MRIALKILSVAVFAALIYAVFIVSNAYVHSTVTPGEEYFVTLSAVISALSLLLLFFNRDIRLTLPDIIVTAFILHTIINFYLKCGVDDYKLMLFMLLGILYFNARVITTFYPGSSDWLVLFILISGITEAVIGIRQTYGLEYSNHSLFKTTGTFFNPGPYAGYLAVVFSLAIGTILKNYKVQSLIFNLKRIRSNYRSLLNVVSLNYAVAWVAVAAIFIILPATMSRAAWLAVIVSALLGFGWYFDFAGKWRYYYKKHRKIAIASSGVALLCVIILIAGLYMMKKGSADGRAFMWKTTARIIKENPVTGVGLGNFGGAYADVQSRYFESGNYTDPEVNIAGNPQYAFNEYLQLFAEGGVIAFVLFCAIAAISVYLLWRRKRHLALGLIALLVFATFSYPFSILPLCILFVLFIAKGSDVFPIAGHKVSVLLFGLICTASLIITAHNASASNERYEALKEWSLVKAIYRMQLYDDILKDYEELYPNLKYQSEFLFEYGHTLNKTGNYSQSNDVLRQGAAINSDPMFHNIMGNNYKGLGDITKAESSYLKGYYITPARIYPLYLLTIMYDEAGDSLKVIEYGEKLLAVDPKIPSSATKDMQKEVRAILSKYKSKEYE